MRHAEYGPQDGQARESGGDVEDAPFAPRYTYTAVEAHNLLRP
jgi:hypothetical protein